MATLCWMGNPEVTEEPIASVAGLTREMGIQLLDRAAEAGLLAAHQGGFYAVHPAVPWHLRTLFARHYGPPGSTHAMAVMRAWTAAIGAFGSYYHDRYDDGYAALVGVLDAEEENLLQARRLALRARLA